MKIIHRVVIFKFESGPETYAGSLALINNRDLSLRNVLIDDGDLVVDGREAQMKVRRGLFMLRHIKPVSSVASFDITVLEVTKDFLQTVQKLSPEAYEQFKSAQVVDKIK